MSAVMSAAAVTSATAARPLLRAAPPLEPPYDDELAAVLPFTPGGRCDPLPFEDGEPLDDEDEDFGPQATPRADLPDPNRWAVQFVRAMLEVLAGQRPQQQIIGWTSEPVYGQLKRIVRHGRPWAARLRSVHVSEPVDGVAEVCAVIRCGPRSYAVAIRLEGLDGRWRCTVLQFG